METQRLKTIQVPDHTLGMLESFAITVLGVPPEARRVNRLAELPPQLRRHIGTGPGQQYVWFAWSAGERTSLLTGTLELERSRERGRPVLEVRSYDADGLLEEASAWVRTGPTEWVRCEW
jgi:hypothetical protein